MHFFLFKSDRDAGAGFKIREREWKIGDPDHRNGTKAIDFGLTAQHQSREHAGPQTKGEERMPHISIPATVTATIHPDEWASIRKEIERCVQAEIEARTEKLLATTQSMVEANEDDTWDPEGDVNIWNLNAMSVATWKSSCWPKGLKWNHDSGKFDSPPARQKRSDSQHWIETNICTLFFTLFPLIFAFLEMSILAAMMDQGSNLKTHIYGDGLYQSPLWRYSNAAHLRSRFVPLLDANGTRVGMTSSVDAFGHSMLKDRPADEAGRCLADDYLMPFAAYKVTSPP